MVTPRLVAAQTALDVGDETVLAGLRQIRGQQQDAVRADTFRRLGHLHSGRRAVAGGSDDRETVGRLLHRRADDLLHLGGAQREEFARAACGEQAGGVELPEPADVVAIRSLVERVISAQVGDRERQTDPNRAGGRFPGATGSSWVFGLLDVGG